MDRLSAGQNSLCLHVAGVRANPMVSNRLMNTNSRSLAARLKDAQAHRGRDGSIRDNRVARFPQGRNWGVVGGDAARTR